MVSYLTSLPQSITALILSLVDTPAYANLTTTYLNDYFNPRTPNVEGVRYFSVAGRCTETSVFHPLWLPKLIIDKAEQVERESVSAERSGEEPTSDAWPSSLVGRFPDMDVDDWGNDGLVTVPSAKWGEFMGVVDGCDHWDIRGAGGFSAAWETAGEAGGLGWVSGMDWSKWGLGWLGSSSTIDSAAKVKRAVDRGSMVGTDQAGSGSPAQRRDDMTSATMSWIADHLAKASLASDRNRRDGDITTPLLSIGPPPKPPMIAAPASERVQEKPVPKSGRNGFDLERLYVALMRKLYEEGL